MARVGAFRICALRRIEYGRVPDGEAARAKGAAMSLPVLESNDWHKAFHDRDLIEVAPLTPEERGVYFTLRMLLIRQHGHTLNDEVSLAAWCKCQPRTFRRVRDRL